MQVNITQKHWRFCILFAQRLKDENRKWIICCTRSLRGWVSFREENFTGHRGKKDFTTIFCEEEKIQHLPSSWPTIIIWVWCDDLLCAATFNRIIGVFKPGQNLSSKNEINAISTHLHFFDVIICKSCEKIV